MKMDNPTTITIIGSLIAALVLAFFGWWAGKVQNNQSQSDKADLIKINKDLGDEVRERDKNLLDLNKELALKSDALYKTSHEQKINLELYAENQKEESQKVQKLQSELIESQKELKSRADDQANKNEEIAKLYKELYNYQTGGDSYAYLNTWLFDRTTKISVSINREGNYPLNKLNICINESVDNGDFANIKTLNIDLLGKQAMIYVGVFPIPDGKKTVIWSIGFQTSDGLKSWYQRIVFKPIDISMDGDIRYTSNTEIYNLDAAKVPMDLIIDGKKFQREGITRNSYTQRILKKDNFFLEKFDWSSYPHHVGCSGIISGGVDKIIHQDSSK